MIDYALILSTNYAGSEWSISGNSYDSLVWYSNTTKPTQAELDALWQPTKDALAKANCKSTAKALLATSDWSVLPDVGLANQDAFVFYRLNLRNLVKDPITDPVFETEPTPVWE
jgi:hypothetical protein